MDSNKKQDKASSEDAFGTDVLNDNVSRETHGRDLSEKEKRKKAQLDNVRNKGGITDDDPYDFNNPTLKELYGDFRSNKLSRLESGFNALYLWCYDNYYSSGVPIKDKYKNIYAHPSAWFKNAHHMWKHNKWSVAVRLLDIVPAIARISDNAKNKRKQIGENFWETFEYSHKSASKALTFTVYLASFAAIVVMFGFWRHSLNQFDMIPALKLYVDGEYIGDVLSISDAQEAQREVEKSLSINLGSSYKLDCSVDFEATKIKEGANLTPARLNRAFGEVAHKEMQNGYGLYVYDVLVAVSPERSWLDKSINQSLEQIIAEENRNTQNTEKVSFNNFVVKQGSYPESFFSTEEEILELFSVQKNDAGSGASDSRDHAYLNVSEKTTLFTGKSAVGTSSDVSSANGEEGSLQIAIETVITNRVTERETIPYGTDYIYTDDLPENRQIVKSAGKNGVKNSTYLIEYGNDDREISRRLLSEVVISQPTNQVVLFGTRTLSEEEKRTASTGTYIFPSQGELSSGYSWRTIGGRNEFHKGIDIRSDKGLVLVASDGGLVIQAHNKGDGYGQCVLIEHDDGTVTRYAHCSKIYVEEGQRVAQGEYIADMGRTGQTTGVHIHFEIITKEGRTVNPLDYLTPVE